MKRFLFFCIVMISVVICQAIPPPDVGTVQYEQVYTNFEPLCADQIIYKFVDRPWVFTGDESVYRLQSAVVHPVEIYAEKYKEAYLPVCTELALLTGNTDEAWNRYKPPLTTWGNGSFYNRPIDLQHTNYGYPLTGN